MTFTFADQAQALAVAARLAELHPSLPAPGLSLSHCEKNALNLCFLDGPADVEAWRVALHVPATEMTCKDRTDGRRIIGFDATVDGVSVQAFSIFGDKQPEGAAA
ncbi:hypothetical protein ACWD3Z_05325 [Streptomyces sp. NPDC002740]